MSENLSEIVFRTLNSPIFIVQFLQHPDPKKRCPSCQHQCPEKLFDELKKIDKEVEVSFGRHEKKENQYKFIPSGTKKSMVKIEDGIKMAVDYITHNLFHGFTYTLDDPRKIMSLNELRNPSITYIEVDYSTPIQLKSSKIAQSDFMSNTALTALTMKILLYTENTWKCEIFHGFSLKKNIYRDGFEKFNNKFKFKICLFR